MSIVTLSSVSKSYGAVPVLNDVSLEVQPGEVVALIGRSGSGKSTLLRCVNALERVQSGSIVVDGMDVTSSATDLRRLRQTVGIVFQSYNLFPHYTAEGNITIALTVVKRVPKREAVEVARAALARVGLADKAASFPHQLSGGQQQRVSIARSLAMQPKIMLFDEVTSALDPELKDEVLGVMEDLAAGGMTMILVTHEMMFARDVADRIVFMHGGRIHEEGPPEKLFKEPRTPELRQFIKRVF
jgi:polar amino acid transport system ATP-binding protein